LVREIQEAAVVESGVTLEQNEQIIGLCYGHVPDTSTAFIDELVVSPSLYGRGLGRYLLVRCAQRLKERGGEECRSCALSTYRTLSRALRLYYQLGFEREVLWTEARLYCPAG